MDKRTLFASLPLLAALLVLQGTSLRAQQPTDSAAQASPTTPSAKPAPADDAAAEASPLDETHTRAAGFAVHTAIPIRLSEAVDSSHIKNGQSVAATISSPVKLSSGAPLPVGTAAKLTVIATVPAGKLNTVGEMSLQLVSVGKTAVFTDTLTYRGKPGHRDLPDSAPAIGTDAGLAKGATLTFHVLPQPTMASGPPPKQGTPDGSVNGVSSGEKPPPKPNASQPSAPPQ